MRFYVFVILRIEFPGNLLKEITGTAGKVLILRAGLLLEAS